MRVTWKCSKLVVVESVNLIRPIFLTTHLKMRNISNQIRRLIETIILAKRK